MSTPASVFESDDNGVGTTSAWDADPWAIPAEPAAYEPAVEAATETEPETEPWTEPQPAEAERDEIPWPERGESTQVMPTSWTPAVPLPREDDGQGELDPRMGDVRTTLGVDQPEADAEAEQEGALVTTAEQAVPWLIGVILLLAGMVIVLLALIFAGDGSLGGVGGDPSGSAVPSATSASSTAATPTPAGTASEVPSGSAEPSATPRGPQYGPLEMVYQGRAAALAPIYLLRRDFTTEEEPLVMAQDPNLDVRRFAWSPDGTRGAGLYADLLVSIETGVEKRPLGDGMSAITFGEDGSTVYAVRITADGTNDVATVLAIDFASGDSSDVASVSYRRPQVGAEPALAEAQFTDDGGTVRLLWMNDNTVRLWVLGGGAWAIDPSDGEATELEADAVPRLWSPDGRRRVGVALNGSTSTIRLVNRAGDEQATTTVEGRVSHVRWSPDGKRVVFTVGHSAPGGGVLQDLYLWDLGEGEATNPMRITDTGAAFGAEWLGGQSIWDD